MEDLVRLQLGYGDKEIAVSSEAGILYDPDETENLPKKLSDLGTWDFLCNIPGSVLTHHRYQTRFVLDYHRRG